MKERQKNTHSEKERSGRFGPFSEPVTEMTPEEVEAFEKKFPRFLKEWEELAEDIENPETG